MGRRRSAARPVVVAAAYAFALAGPLGPGACRDVTAPLPAGATRFTPPPAYARWWALTQECAGLRGNFAAYSWYVVPGDRVPDAGYENVAAYTDVFARRIVIASYWRNDGGTVRHEVLHALLGWPYAAGTIVQQHPPAYFQGLCRGVVDCPALGCRDAGTPPSPAPAGAPALPLSALSVRVEVEPTPVSRTGADRGVTLVVRVTNPRPEPVWVSLNATPDLPSPWVRWFGFRIIPAAQSIPTLIPLMADTAGFVTADSVPRVAFGAGQTRRWVVDVGERLYAAGEYQAVGVFNTRQVATPLTIVP